nr:hypothetical protein [Tanacetum cinerariifolium]
MQTQTSNTLHNAIMEADSKDRPPMLAPDTEVPISKGSPVTRTKSQMETYKTVSQDIRDQINAEAEAVQIILTRIDNDIYSTCKLFPLLGKLSIVSAFLDFGLTFAGTSKYWGVLRILMIGLRLIPLLVEIFLFIVDFGCSKHMTGNLKLLINFVEKFLRTVKFRNGQIAPILGYEDLGNDLLTGSRGTDLYSITLQDTNCPNPICLMAKVSSSQVWLWHRCLSHLNFDTINLLSKNDIVVGLPKLKFVKDHLCSSLIVDDYSRYTWTYFLRFKDEIHEVLINFLRLVQRGLQAQVRIVRTDKGTEFLNQTLHAYFATEGIPQQTFVARTPEQNGVVERRNRTLIEAARTMLSATKVPLFFWAKAIATTCFTQNRSLVIPRHEKIPYHIINDRKPSVKFFHIFGSLCYIVRDGE